MKEKGLTLVELLVVTAVVIALASIALSVYQLARERAWTVECMNNLRQIHLAWQMSVEELGYIPESHWELFGVPPDHPEKKRNPNLYTGPWWRYAKTKFYCPLAIRLAPNWVDSVGTYHFPILDLGRWKEKGLIKQEPKYPPENAAVATCDGILCRGIGVPPRVTGIFHDLGVDLSGHIGRIVPSPGWCDAFLEFEMKGKTNINAGWITIR